MTPAMQQRHNASLQRQYARIDAEAARRKANNTSGLMAFELSHYGEPIRIHPSKYGLSLEEVEAMREPKVMLALEEYNREFAYLSRSGMTLRSYVATAYSDYSNEPLPPRLGSACDKLQRHFGEPVSIASQFGFPS